MIKTRPSRLLRTHVNGTVLFIIACTFPVVLPAQSTRSITLVAEYTLNPGKEDLVMVNGGHANSRGDIALTVRTDYQARIYDKSGRLVATIGRRGNGPGEFQSPQVQGWVADTIWIFDTSLRRNSYFTRDGKLLRTELVADGRSVSVPSEGTGASLAYFTPLARLHSGDFVGGGTLIRPVQKKAQQSEQVLARLSTDGTARLITVMEQDDRWERELAFTTFMDVQPGGNLALAIKVSDLTVSGSKVMLSWIDINGRIVGTAEFPYTGIPYPKNRLDAALRRGLGPDRNKKVIASRIPRVLGPVIGSLLRDDGIALINIVEPNDRSKVVVVDPRGSVRGEFSLPPRTYLVATLGSYVWVRTVGNDGVLASVIRYRMQCQGKDCF